MAFGQHAGPPATSRQVDELLGLLHAAGHEGFRDARGPMGFTQRQAAGRFTRVEAEALIARLQAGRTTRPYRRPNRERDCPTPSSCFAGSLPSNLPGSCNDAAGSLSNRDVGRRPRDVTTWPAP